MASRLVARGGSLLQARNKATGVIVKNPSAEFLPIKGLDAAKTPIKVELQAGKTYHWCACGLSKIQPFCDGTHKINGLTSARPVSFEVEKTGSYRLCACKQTESRPLCDGSHKQVTQRPRSEDASVAVSFGNSPVYGGVAHSLGYKHRDSHYKQTENNIKYT